MACQNDMANIHGDYITPNFVRIIGKLDRDKTFFFNVNGRRVHPRHFIWLRMGTIFSATLVTILEVTTLTQFPPSIITWQFLSFILVRV